MSFILSTSTGVSSLTVNNKPIIGNNITIDVTDNPSLEATLSQFITENSQNTFTNKK